MRILTSVAALMELSFGAASARRKLAITDPSPGAQKTIQAELKCGKTRNIDDEPRCGLFCPVGR